MGQSNKLTFEIGCSRHGQHKSGYGPIARFLRVNILGKRRNCCPLCRKEYIIKNKIEKPETVDWRYIQFS